MFYYEEIKMVKNLLIWVKDGSIYIKGSDIEHI